EDLPVAEAQALAVFNAQLVVAVAAPPAPVSAMAAVAAIAGLRPDDDGRAGPVARAAVAAVELHVGDARIGHEPDGRGVLGELHAQIRRLVAELGGRRQLGVAALLDEIE